MLIRDKVKKYKYLFIVGVESVELGDYREVLQRVVKISFQVYDMIKEFISNIKIMISHL